MKKEVRTVCYDEELHLEAYRFEGIVQPFPNHFHDYYVIGFMEAGTRCLSCKNTEYMIKQGDILLFNPNDNHGCTQSEEGTFDYRGINIPVSTMLSLSEEILRSCLKSLHEMLLFGGEKFEKEEMLFLFMSMLMERYGQPFESCIPECQEEIEAACLFMEEHYSDHISLEQLCQCSTLSKSTLLKAFTKVKSVKLMTST